MAAPKQSILPLLKALSTARPDVTPDHITSAIALSFRDELSPAQTAALLTALHFTGLDQQPAIIAAAATAMRDAGLRLPPLPTAVHGTHSAPGSYGGGLVSTSPPHPSYAISYHIISHTVQPH